MLSTIPIPKSITTERESRWPETTIVIVPVFNHGLAIGKVVSEIIETGATVIVVDDGSTDGSGLIAKQNGATLITHPHNCGKAAALLTGMRWAHQKGYYQAITVDADGQHPIDAVLTLLHRAIKEPNAIHLGQRDMVGAPMSSHIGRGLSNWATWMNCGVWPGDSQSGLRAYPITPTLQLDIQSKDYTWEIEVLIKAVWAHMKVRSVKVPVIYPENRISHFNKYRDNARAARIFIFLFIVRICKGILRIGYYVFLRHQAQK